MIFKLLKACELPAIRAVIFRLKRAAASLPGCAVWYQPLFLVLIPFNLMYPMCWTTGKTFYIED
jgi:hypothetical protein